MCHQDDFAKSSQTASFLLIDYKYTFFLLDWVLVNHEFTHIFELSLFLCLVHSIVKTPFLQDLRLYPSKKISFFWESLLHYSKILGITISIACAW
jgi:hypothetical protein